MIIEALMNLLHGLAVALFSFLRDVLPAAPGFWTDAAAAIGSVLGLIPGPILYFFPVGPVVAAGLAMVALIGVVGGLRLARRVLSLFTGGGGNA